MRCAGIFVIAFAVLAVASLDARAEPGPCQEKNPKQKAACLKKRFGDLEATFKLLSEAVDKATAVANAAKVDAGKATTAAGEATTDAGKAIKYEDAVQIRSELITDKCLDPRSNPNPNPSPMTFGW